MLRSRSDLRLSLLPIMKRFAFLLLLAVVLPLWGCDSSDDLADADLFGVWEAEAASIRVAGFANVDVFTALQSEDRATMTFASRGQYSFSLQLAEPRSLVIPNTEFSLTLESSAFEGGYGIESNSRIRFSINGVPGETTLEYRYRASAGGDQLTLLLRNPEEARAALGFLLGSDELARLITGGEIRLRRTE